MMKPAARPGTSASPHDAPLFDTGAYASTFPERFQRALELGPKYYLLDVPRYLSQRRRLGLPVLDLPVLWNPARSFRSTPYRPLTPPPHFAQALDELRAARISFDNSRLRVEALAAAWWHVHSAPGMVIECGAFRGAVSLLLAVLGKLNRVEQTVLMLDTFTGMPAPSQFDLSRQSGEYSPPAGWPEVLSAQCKELAVADRVEIHQGLFEETFRKLEPRDPKFSFVHIDANIYQGTLDACRFTIPRVSLGGAVVFDDYNGLCDLGARLAIDEFLTPESPKPEPLAECSACLWL